MLSKSFFVSQKSEVPPYSNTQGLKILQFVVVGLVILLIVVIILARSQGRTTNS